MSWTTVSSCFRGAMEPINEGCCLSKSRHRNNGDELCEETRDLKNRTTRVAESRNQSWRRRNGMILHPVFEGSKESRYMRAPTASVVVALMQEQTISRTMGVCKAAGPGGWFWRFERQGPWGDDPAKKAVKSSVRHGRKRTSFGRPPVKSY